MTGKQKMEIFIKSWREGWSRPICLRHSRMTATDLNIMLQKPEYENLGIEIYKRGISKQVKTSIYKKTRRFIRLWKNIYPLT